MPALKDDPNTFRGEIGHASSGVRSLASVASCLGAGCIPRWQLLSQITTSESCFPRGAEDPAGTPGARTCGKSPFTKCYQKFARKEFYQFWPCSLQPRQASPRQRHSHQLCHVFVGMCRTC